MSIKETQNKKDGNVCIDIKVSGIKMECLNCYEEKPKSYFYTDFIPICKKHNICKDCVLRYKNLKEINNHCYCFYCYPLGFQTKSYSPSLHGGSATFPGTSDEIKTSDGSSNQVVLGSGDFTVEFWIYKNLFRAKVTRIEYL